MKIILRCIIYIAHLFWAILGFLFWIPLLFRVIAGFCGSIVYNMLANNPDNIKKNKELLEAAISFYANGFVVIESTYTESGNNSSNINSVAQDLKAGPFFLQIIWTIVFWGIIMVPLLL